MIFAPLAIIAATALQASAVIFDKTASAANSRIVPGRYIVEYSSAGAKRSDPHEHFSSHMRRQGVDFSVERQYSNEDIFVGASVSVPNADDVARVAEIPGVVNVWPVRLMDRPEPYGGSQSIINAAAASNPTDTFSTHQMTGVDKLHNQGILGAGVTIGIIDSGIDYTHPALGNGCFGKPECKVVGGYDFVGDAYNAETSPVPVPDNDPKDCGGHGSHVSGIIGADMNPLNFTGVAPAAKLRGYRIFGCTGSVADDIVVEAMLKAAEDRVQVISMSLGGPAGWTEGPSSVIASRIIKFYGIVMSISQGNSGAVGTYYASGPSSGVGVISVASVDNIVTPSMPGLLSNGFAFQLKSGEPIEIDPKTKFPIALSSNDLNPASDGCIAYPAGTNNAGKVVLVRRGTCSFSVKAQNVYDTGARIMLIYDNVDGAPITPSLGDVQITAPFITQADGLAIKKAILADPSITLTFSDQYYNFPSPTGGLISDFSSWGLTNDNYIKPTIAAPGGSILSTWPVAKGSYNQISGTSMACPFITGVVALYISHNGAGVGPDGIKDILQGSAKPIYTSIGGSQVHSVAQAGAGLVDAYTAVMSRTVVSPGEVALNDTAHALKSTKISIVNTGSTAVSYKLSHLPAAAALTFSDNGNQPNVGPVPQVSGDATLSFPGGTFVSVGPVSEAEFDVDFTFPTNLDASQVPIFSGYIVVESADQTIKYTIPYAGTAANLNVDYPIFDTGVDTYFEGKQIFLSSKPSDMVPIEEGTVPTFTFAGDDSPSIIYRLLGGSAQILFELVDPSTEFTPTITKRHYSQNKLHRVVRRAAPTTPNTIGLLFSSTYNYRNTLEQGKGTGYFQYGISATTKGFYFSDGKKVPNGTYKLLVRGLKFYGDETDASQYESWLSPAFTVNQA